MYLHPTASTHPHPVPNVANVVAQIVQFTHSFGWGDNGDELAPSDHAEVAAYVCACFLAQHADGGEVGVGHDEVMLALKVDQAMSLDDRLELAEAFVKEIGKW